MEWLETIVALFTIALLRLGIPIGLTALLVWSLKKLDAHWQAQATRQRNPAPAQSDPPPRMPCWKQRNCPPEQRERCPAFARQNMPCWQVFRGGNGHLKETCFSCPVFRGFPAPTAV